MYIILRIVLFLKKLRHQMPNSQGNSLFLLDPHQADLRNSLFLLDTHRAALRNTLFLLDTHRAALRNTLFLLDTHRADLRIFSIFLTRLRPCWSFLFRTKVRRFFTSFAL